MMAGTIHMKLAVLVLATTWIYCLTDAKKSKFPIDRSYQLSPVAVVNGAQGIQYYATGPAFAAVPAVLANPTQISVNSIHPPSMPGFVLQSGIPNQLPKEFYEASPPPAQSTYQPPTGAGSQVYQPPTGSGSQAYQPPTGLGSQAHQPSASLGSQAYQPPTGLASQTSHHDTSHYHFTHKPKIRSHPPISYKRPGSYINSVHHHSPGPKHTLGLSGYMNHKPSFSVQPSIDLSDNQATPPSFLSTVAPPSASTYGPPKPIEFQHKHRPPTGSGPMYHRHKGHGHIHRIYSPKPMRVYSHFHNGHIHKHYMPSYSTPLYKSQLYSPKPTSPTFIKPSVPPYLPPSVESPTGFSSFSQENPYKSQDYPKPPNHNYHAYPQSDLSNSFPGSGNIRFPDSFESTKLSDNPYSPHQTEYQGLSDAARPHEGLTQAIIKEQGIINNHDASLPLKIPTQKPNQFAVNDILKNADIHYVDGNEQPQSVEQSNAYENHKPTHTTFSNPSVLVQQAHPAFQYQDSQVFDPSQPTYQTFAVEQVMNPESYPGYASNHQGVTNQLEFYDPRINPADHMANLYQSNYLQSEQELGTSDSFKVPVAIFRGIQSTNGQGMFAVALKRSDEAAAAENSNSDFTPTKLSSDWIPMSGGNVKSSAPRAEKLQSAETAEAVTYGKLEGFGDQFFAGLTTKNRDKKDDLKQRYTETTPIITSNRDIGDIISGKIPSEFAPFKTNSREKISNIRTIDTKNGRDSDIVTGKISFDNTPSSERRRGSVIDDSTGLSPESFKFGDTSNLVVSSVIKFS